MDPFAPLLSPRRIRSWWPRYWILDKLRCSAAAFPLVLLKEGRPKGGWLPRMRPESKITLWGRGRYLPVLYLYFAFLSFRGPRTLGLASTGLFVGFLFYSAIFFSSFFSFLICRLFVPSHFLSVSASVENFFRPCSRHRPRPFFFPLPSQRN